MAKKLSKTGISTSSTIQAWHVSQSVDALASPNVDAYDIGMSGSVSITGSFNINGVQYPSSTVLDGEVIVASEDGSLTFGHGEKLHLQIRNNSGVTIPAGTPIYPEGEVGGSERILVGISSASRASTMPAIGITETELDTGAGQDGFAIINGVYNTNITPVDTTGLVDGATLYVHANGYITPVKPTGSNLIQNIGTVLKTNGTIIQGMKVSSIDRTNDIPNITPGYFWVGNTDSVPVAVATSSIVVNPAGSNTQVQFNDDGVLAGASGVTYNIDRDTLLVNRLDVTTAITASGAISSSYNGENTFAGLIYLANNKNLGGYERTNTSARPLILRNSDDETQLGSVHYPIRIANDITGSIALTGSIDVAFSSGSSHKSFRVMGTHSVPAWTVGTTIDFYVDEYIRLHWDGTSDFEAEILTNPSSNDVHIVYNNDGTYTFLDRQNSDGQFIIDTSFTSDEIGIATFRAPDDDTWPYYKVTLVQGSGLSYTKTMYAIVEKLVNE